MRKGRSMIVDAELICQPYAGEYREIIYDIPSPWNSPNWTWVKFINEDYTEWCGEFRGLPRKIAISKKYNITLILTSDYLYQIDCDSTELLDYESQPQYKNLTVMPSGEFLLSDDYSIELIMSSLNDKELIKSPLDMDNIEFGIWHDNILIILCDEFMNLDNHVELAFNSETMEIVIKKSN